MSTQAGIPEHMISSYRSMLETVRVALMKESLKKKAQLFKCTEALDGLLTKGMSLKIFLEFFKGRRSAFFQ